MMRRLRLFRRRDRQQDSPSDEYPAPEGDAPFEPFVPVSPPEEPPRRRFRPSLPRPGVPRLRRPTLRRPSMAVEVRFGMLVIVVALVVAGIFGTLLKQDRIHGDLKAWWPLAILGGAAVWMLAALLRRRAAAFLGAAAVAGVGLSLLMDAQDIAQAQETLLGVVLVTVGLGIVVRGFLLRQQAFDGSV